MNKEYFEIPLNKLEEGVSLCFRKSFAFSINARLLFENHQDPDIVSALLVSAIEELGKGLFLKEFCNEQTILIPKWLFGIGFQTHTKKIQKGLEELGEESLLHPKFFEILSDRETKINNDGTMTYKGVSLSQDELIEITQTGFGQDYDSMVDYKSQLDQNKKFQLFYVSWNEKKEKWQYGMWHNDFQINNILGKLEKFLKKYHNTNANYSFEYY